MRKEEIRFLGERQAYHFLGHRPPFVRHGKMGKRLSSCNSSLLGEDFDQEGHVKSVTLTGIV